MVIVPSVLVHSRGWTKISLSIKVVGAKICSQFGQAQWISCPKVSRDASRASCLYSTWYHHIKTSFGPGSNCEDSSLKMSAAVPEIREGVRWRRAFSLFGDLLESWISLTHQSLQALDCNFYRMIAYISLSFIKNYIIIFIRIILCIRLWCAEATNKRGSW